MSKKFKLLATAVSVVMAGTMAFGIFGCGGGDDEDKIPDGEAEFAGVERTDINYDENHHLTYAATTALSLHVGNGTDADQQSIDFRKKEISGNYTLPDGKSYSQGSLKPAWQALQDRLGITITSDWTSTKGVDDVISHFKDSQVISQKDIFTCSVAIMTLHTGDLVNLNDYLEYMPNYKAFLRDNPMTRWSLTSDTATGAMYYAPYYDGNDDIEKYCLATMDWITAILDTENIEETATFAAQAAKKGTEVEGTVHSVESYMGQDKKWEVETSKPGDNSTVPEVVKVTVDYDAVIDALEDKNSNLYKAIAAINGMTNIQTDSGNIVDIQNDIIDTTSGVVTGAQLAKVTQEYIKVAYKLGKSQLYGATVNGVQTKLSDVFTSTYAAWDVDLLVALGRCAVTNPTLLNGSVDNLANIYAVSARQGTTQRRVDLTALAGELYGVRGLESRYEYLYVAKDGSIKDARNNKDSYELVSKLNGLAKEGLLYTGKEDMNGKDRDIASRVSTLMMHDYSNTQTKACWGENKVKIAPINTPVSKWDTDDNGSHETIMRFTESWRSVKNTGFCIPKAAVEGDKDKLSACLALIDYLFSNDGQLLMTFGPQSTTGDTNPNGWWYGTEVTNTTIQAERDAGRLRLVCEQTQYAPAQYAVVPKADGSSDYFVYNGKLYTGFSYKGGQIPKMTTASFNFYDGQEVTVGETTIKQGVTGSQLVANGVHDYTGYARKIVGSTLPIGNKNQGFEYQATAQCAIDGQAVVGKSLLNGTIKHVKLSVSKNESKWYLICPSAFAMNSTQQGLITDNDELLGHVYYNSSDGSKYPTNLYIDLMYYGYNTAIGISSGGSTSANDDGKIPANAQGCVDKMKTIIDSRVSIYNQAWNATKTYFNIG